MLQKAKWLVDKLGLKAYKSWSKELPKNTIKFSFCEQNADLASVLAEVFAKVDEVEVLQGNILKLSADALVSPANSFGDMSGGLDQAIDDYYKGEAQSKASSLIRSTYYGELAVGQAAILEMNQARFPKLILAPTMRVPGKVAKSINAYLAMRALLIAVLDYNKQAQTPIQHIAMTSLCTGIGRMPFVEAAEQMLVAYDMIIKESWKKIVHPSIAPYSMKTQD